MSIEQGDPWALLSEKVDILEDGFKMYRSRQDALGKEVKVILAEIHIITEWIHQRFGVELLNKNSFLFKHIHDFEEVAEISATLCLLANVATNAQKYTGAELAAAAAAAAAGNAAAAAAAANASNQQDHRGGYSSNSPVSPSPTSSSGGSRNRFSAEHPPRPISTPPMISGHQHHAHLPQSPYHHQQHTILISGQPQPAPAHSNSSYATAHHHHQHHLPSQHPHHSHNSVGHSGNHPLPPSSPSPSPHHVHQQMVATSTSTSVQQQYILPHSPTSQSSPTPMIKQLSPQSSNGGNCSSSLLPPPPPPAPMSGSTSPTSPTNYNNQSQLIISKKSKPNNSHQSNIHSPPSSAPPTTNKLLLPPPPPSTKSQHLQNAPVSVVTLVPSSPSPPPASTSSHISPNQSSSSSYQNNRHQTHQSYHSSPSPPAAAHTLQQHQNQPPPAPSTPSVTTHISVPPKKSLSSRNAHNLANSTGSANIKKYFKPLVIVQQQDQPQTSHNIPIRTTTHQQKPTTGTLVESHSTIGQVYIFSESLDEPEDHQPPLPPPPVNEMKTSTNEMDTSEGHNLVEVRPVTPVNSIGGASSTPEPEVLRPKRRNRKKGGGGSGGNYGGGANKGANRLLNNKDAGGRNNSRSPNHNTNSLDYTADTEDEVPPSSRDSTPVHTNKRKILGSPTKPLKTSTPITTTPKSSKLTNNYQQSLRSNARGGRGGASGGSGVGDMDVDGIPPSPIAGPSSHSSSAIATLNSSSNCSSRDSSKHQQSGGEESSSTGTSEKLPKRGRPKKRPEERVRTYDPRVPMQCDECGKVLKGTGALRVHKQIHQNIRPYDCTVCGRAFRRKHHLEFHMMIHEGNKKETCSYCGKAFLIRRDLARHERTHTGEKPYSCHLCPKSFNVKQHLTLHIRTHTGERPYRCPVCDKTFTQANSLRIHKKIHLRERERAEAGGGNGGGNNGSGGGNNASGNNSSSTGGSAKGGAKGKGGGNRNSNSSTSSTSTNSNASNSSNSSIGGSSTTSGISSASMSALETPDRNRPPSSEGGGSENRVASPSPSLSRSGQSSPPSPAMRQHPLLQHVHIPPPVAETVTVVTSPPANILSAVQNNNSYEEGGQLRSGENHNAYHGLSTNQHQQPGSPPRSWRLSLNPGSGTNLISPPGANSSSRAGSPQHQPSPVFTIPAAHQVQPSTGGNPGHYAVIRNMAPVTGPTLVRAYSPSEIGGSNPLPAHHHHSQQHGHHVHAVTQPPTNPQSSSGGAPVNSTYATLYDPSNPATVTRYYN